MWQEKNTYLRSIIFRLYNFRRAPSSQIRQDRLYLHRCAGKSGVLPLCLILAFSSLVCNFIDLFLRVPNPIANE